MAKTPRAPRARDTASNEQVARLWKASAQDVDASDRFEAAIQGLLAAGKLNPSRTLAIRGRIAADDEEIFEKVLLDCATDRFLGDGPETATHQVRAFGLVLQGDAAAIEAALREPEAWDGLTETLKVTEFVHSSSQVALLPYALSPMDLARIGPQGLYDLTAALAKDALGPQGEIPAEWAALLPDLAADKASPPDPDIANLGVRVLLGVQVVGLDALSDEFPDGLQMQLELHDLETEPDLGALGDEDPGDLELGEAEAESEPAPIEEAGETSEDEEAGEALEEEDLAFYNALVHDLEERALSWREATAAWLREAGDRFMVLPPLPFTLLRTNVVTTMVHQRVDLVLASETDEGETIDGLEIDFRPQGLRVDIWRNARQVDGIDIPSELAWPYLDDIFDELEMSYEVVVRDEMEDEPAAPPAT